MKATIRNIQVIQISEGWYGTFTFTDKFSNSTNVNTKIYQREKSAKKSLDLKLKEWSKLI